MKKAKLYKTAKISLEIFFGLIAVAFVAFFIMSKVSASPVFVFDRTAMWVMTESMDPTIPPKTYILVEKATADDVEVGDIIVFRSTDPRIYGEYNTHRVINKTGNVFVTKGDHNGADDGEYSAKAENIIGRYVKDLPVMTYIGRVVMTPAGFAVLIALFLATTVICFIPDIKEAAKLKEQEDAEEKEKEKRRLIDEEICRLKSNDSMKETVVNSGEEKKE